MKASVFSSVVEKTDAFFVVIVQFDKKNWEYA